LLRLRVKTTAGAAAGAVAATPAAALEEPIIKLATIPHRDRKTGEFRLLIAVLSSSCSCSCSSHPLTLPAGSSHSLLSVLSYGCCFCQVAHSLIIITIDDGSSRKRGESTHPFSLAKEKAADIDPKKNNTRITASVMDLLRSLPANIVANYIYPFAVKVIQNRDELIVAIDEYLDEYYSGDHGEGKNDDEDDIKNHRIRYPIGDWDVSRVDDFTSVMDRDRNRKAEHFNEDLSRWNVTNGTRFARMFFGCNLFRSDLSKWNVANATDLSFMFARCTSFNADLSTWNVVNATDLNRMFYGCTSFNSDLSRWNVANATDLGWMFYLCISFNSDLSNWNVANVTNLGSMFYGCTSFNSDLSEWNVANATNLSEMFRNCTSFNADLSRWNVSNVHYLSEMFRNCTSFNADLSRWNVSNVHYLGRMFFGCTSFNSNVSQWDVANAIQNMDSMFYGCDSFDSTFVATWPLRDEQHVEQLFSD
jgi:surface protein